MVESTEGRAVTAVTQHGCEVRDRRGILAQVMRSLRFILVTLIGLLLISAALPAAAAEDGSTPSDVEEVAEENPETLIQPAYEPAVVVEPAANDEIEPAWTTKFLVPTGLLIAAIALLSTVVMYFVRVVRTRYKVVE